MVLIFPLSLFQKPVGGVSVLPVGKKDGKDKEDDKDKNKAHEASAQNGKPGNNQILVR